MSNQSSKQYEMQGQYTPENSALVLIDHQVGTLTFVHNRLRKRCRPGGPLMQLLPGNRV
jgi:hypothetical protein